jgi:hypothetical protein
MATTVLAACSRSSAVRTAGGPTPTTTPVTVTVTSAAAAAAAAAATVTPTSASPAFTGAVARVTAAELPSSWRSGCPVGPDDLRMLTLSYWGFDDRPHTGSLVVRATVAQAVVDVFRRLYDRRFPIRRMEPVDAYGGSDDASIAADNTAGFNCRNAVASGPPHWSAHAYGEAVDVNPVENPYLEGGQVLPPSGAAFVDRSNVRPGMAVRGGELTSAFAAAGWSWGGAWSAPDYQHFSSTGT